MDSIGTSSNSRGRARQWFRGLRPLAWWVLLVLALFGYRENSLWIERTRLTFSIGLEGREDDSGASALLDGAPFRSEGKISLGSHTFAASHPQGDSFSTNLSIWYGHRDLGDITLKRSTGTLVVQASPPASLLTIWGPEFKRTLTNSVGTTLVVPTDRYTVEAKYAHWGQVREATVSHVFPGTVTINAPLGTVRIASSNAEVSFRLQSADDGGVALSGELPATLADLPAGNYLLTAQHHGDAQEKAVVVRARATNDVRVEFPYGSATFETEPAGASVIGRSGQVSGLTPVTLSELKPGHWEFTLQKAGYEPVLAAFEVVASETNRFQTNLITVRYSQGITSAQRYLDTGDFERAVEAAGQAREAKPGDAAANALLNEATGRAHLRNSANYAKLTNYARARTELSQAMQLLPDDVSARGLLAGLNQAEHDQAERERQERPQKAFNLAAQALRNEGQLMGDHEVTAKMTAADVEAALLKVFRDEAPGFAVVPLQMPFPDAFGFTASQATLLGGARHCIVGGAQTGEKETKVRFRVIEGREVYGVNVQNLLNVRTQTTFVPLDPTFRGELTEAEKVRIQEGLRMVGERIQRALEKSTKGEH